MVGVSYHIPAGPHPEFAAVDVLATESAGRLYKALVETKKASSLIGSSFAWRDPGLMTMMAEVRDAKQLDRVPDEMLAEIEKIGTEGVTDAESLQGMNVACSLLPTLMRRGTNKLDYQQLEDALDKNRAGLNGSGSLGTATFTVQTNRQHLDAVLEPLKQLLREPTLPAEELEVLRREQLARYEKNKTDPQALAANSFRRTLSPYAKDDVRYNPTVEESIERTKSVTLEQIQTLHRKFLGAAHAEVAVVGDFNPETTRPILAEMLGDWNGQRPYVRIPQKAFTEVKGQTVSINTPDKANAVYFGDMALPLQDTDPDYPALILSWCPCWPGPSIRDAPRPSRPGSKNRFQD